MHERELLSVNKVWSFFF